MASQAAIDGIAANGWAWKLRRPRIRELCKRIGELRDADSQDAKALVRTAHAIATEIDKWVSRLESGEQLSDFLQTFEWRHRYDIDTMHEFTVEDAEAYYLDMIEEVVYALNNIYDTFDYERILVR